MDFVGGDETPELNVDRDEVMPRKHALSIGR
jgi:hypothetical protein